jgi:hypothetical protein
VELASAGALLVLRSLARLGSQVSVFGRLGVSGDAASVFSDLVLGSYLSVRYLIRLGSSASVFGGGFIMKIGLLYIRGVLLCLEALYHWEKTRSPVHIVSLSAEIFRSNLLFQLREET